MILVIIQMKVTAENRMEMSQAVASLSDYIKNENGCQRCDFCQSVVDDGRFYLLEEWHAQADFMAHMSSEYFRVLRGALNLFQDPGMKRSCTVFSSIGAEDV